MPTVEEQPATRFETLAAHPTRRGSRARRYAVRVPEGRERAAAEAIARALAVGAASSAGGLQGGPASASGATPACLAPRAERWMRRSGVWRLEMAPLIPGYVFAEAGGARELSRAIARSGASAQAAPAGTAGDPTPLDEAGWAWLVAALDASGVLRASTGRIRGGRLAVESGPLRGSEGLVAKIDRHRRLAWVAPGGRDGLLVRVALEVTEKD